MKLLGLINAIGVLILATICAFQWRVNRSANLTIFALDHMRLEQARKIEDQQANIARLNADLADFRQRLATTREQLDKTEKDLSIMTADRDKTARQLDRMTSERDQLLALRDELIATVNRWAVAVTARDEALHVIDDNIITVCKQRDEVITRYNDLAAKFNLVVKDLNEARARFGGR